MSENAIRVSSEDLRRLTIAFFEKAGTSTGDAEFMARLLVQGLGGILAGIYKPEVQASQSRWESNQGGFVAVFDVACFMPVDEFKKEMDRYMGQARSMQPLPGEETAELAGTLEWQREQDYAREGIPLTVQHKQRLEDLAAELGVETSFAAEV